MQIAEALAGLGPDAVLVTASRRLARLLRRRYGMARRDADDRVWETPPIVSWAGWLESLWSARVYSAAAAVPLLLDAEQERALWQRTIEDAGDGCALLSISATAAAARDSWGLTHAWRLDRRAMEAAPGEDTRAFLGWVREFEHACENHDWLDGARMPDHLADAAASLPLPRRVLLAGFDEFTPQQQRFLDAIRAAGAVVSEVDRGRAERGAAARAAFPDRTAELAAAARWARARAEANASAEVAVVVPGLEGARAEVERIFTEVLDPAAILPGAHGRAAAFNISAGEPLAACPIVRAAFLALALDPARNDIGELSAFLRSPFVAGADTERTARARLDAEIRKRGAAMVSAATVERLAEQNCPALAGALRRWRALFVALPRTGMPSAWSRAFSALLAALGWPGERSLSTAEYQAAQAWKELLAAFARLDLTAVPHGTGQALSHLRRMAGEMMFQPEGDDAAVQVLGPLEAAGLRLDHLWVAGLDEEAWPRAPRPDPFLPAAMQREKGLPHSSAARELEFARLTTERLLGSAAEVVVSHAARGEDDRQVGPSPLIRGIPEVEPPDLGLAEHPRFAEMVGASSRLEVFEDRDGPPVDGAWQRGGTKVFQYQATCPFRAFAELRLAAVPLDMPEDGLAPRDRGVLVHNALECVWGELGSQAHLRALDAEGIREIVRAAIAQAMDRLMDRRGEQLPPRFGAIERSRLESLIGAWLEVEKRRPPFSVVAPERERQVEVGGIRARVRADRIDRLADGREAIIDYKTGKANPNDWEGDRPSQPQLPLYAASHDGPLGAVLIAQLRAGKLGFFGITSEPAAAEGAKTADLGARIAEWQLVLERLGEAFRSGRAEVDPKNKAECPRCPLAALCRIHDVELETSAFNGEANRDDKG